MSQYYVYLKSKCCGAKIHNGLLDIGRLNECSGCKEKIKDIINGSYDIRMIDGVNELSES